jgi:hypothetical protein
MSIAPAPAQLQVIAWLGQIRPRANLPDHHVVVFAAGRRALLDDVRHRLVGPAQRGLGLVRGEVGRLDPVGEVLGTDAERRLLLTLDGAHLVRELLLLRPQNLVRLQGRPPRLVRPQKFVHEGLRRAPGPLARSDAVGIFAE